MSEQEYQVLIKMLLNQVKQNENIIVKLQEKIIELSRPLNIEKTDDGIMVAKGI